MYSQLAGMKLNIKANKFHLKMLNCYQSELHTYSMNWESQKEMFFVQTMYNRLCTTSDVASAYNFIPLKCFPEGNVLCADYVKFHANIKLVL